MRKAEIIVRRRRAGGWLTTLSAAAIAAVTLTPSGQTPGVDALCIVCGEFGGVNAFLNVVMFVPLGFGLALRGLHAWPSMGIMFLATALIETVQLTFIRGRDATAGDILTNIVGGALGFLAAQHWGRLMHPGRRGAMTLACVWAGLVLVVLLVSSYALVPLPGTLPYFGQVARDLGPQLRAFSGLVMQPRIGSHVISDSGFASREIPILLAAPAGVPTSVSVVANGCPADPAGILHVSDARQQEILTMYQRNVDVIYGIRTGADALRLRPFRYRLARVFGDATCRVDKDSIAITVRISRTEVSMRAASAMLTRSELVPRRLMESWRLITPWQTFASGDGIARWVSALWTALIVLPLGYWLRFALPPVAAVVGAAVVLAAGFILIPRALSVPSPAFYEVVATSAAIALGMYVARARTGPYAIGAEPAREQAPGT